MSTPEASGPSKAIIGWLEYANKRDAIEYAKGYVQRSFTAPELSWYDVEPFMGGYLYEVQEGGPGRSHLASALKVLAADEGPAWFRSGSRAFTVSMRDGRPFCVLLSNADSQALITSEKGKLTPKGVMKPVINKGTMTLAVGGALFGAGTTVLLAAVVFAALSQKFIPSERLIDISTMPHRQWSRVQSVPPTLFVESLRLMPDTPEWKAAVKPIPPKGAPGDPADPAPPAPEPTSEVTAPATSDTGSDLPNLPTLGNTADPMTPEIPEPAPLVDPQAAPASNPEGAL